MHEKQAKRNAGLDEARSIQRRQDFRLARHPNQKRLVSRARTIRASMRAASAYSRAARNACVACGRVRYPLPDRQILGILIPPVSGIDLEFQLRDRAGCCETYRSQPRVRSRRWPMDRKRQGFACATTRWRTWARYSLSVIALASPSSTSALRRSISGSNACVTSASGSPSELEISLSTSRRSLLAGKRRIGAVLIAAVGPAQVGCEWRHAIESSTREGQSTRVFFRNRGTIGHQLHAFLAAQSMLQ